MRAGRPTRWSGGVLVALAAGSLALAACSSSPSSSGSASGSTAAAQDKTVVLGSFGGSPEAGFEKCVLQPFTKATGITVKYDVGTNAELTASAIAQRGNPPFDVQVGATNAELLSEKDGLLAPIDLSKITNLKNIPKQYATGDTYNVPFSTDISGIAYNTQEFKAHGWAPPTSWNDLFDPKYKGHTALEEISNVFTPEFVYQLSALNGGSIDTWQQGEAKLATLAPNIVAMYAADSELDQGMESGGVWIAMRGGNRVLPLIQSGLPLAFVQPKEGVGYILLGLQLMKGAKNVPAAYALMNYFDSTQAQACMTQETGYGALDPAAASSPGYAAVAKYSVPEASIPIPAFNWNTMNAQSGALTEQFDKDFAK